MDLQPGTNVTPTVRLVKLLGEGGMGSVWIADHTALNTQVAVKFVSAELVIKDPTIMERFNREASMSAQIKSPYVVQTFDHGVMDDGRPYIVMELLEGETLAEVLAARELTLEETRLIVAQTAKALSKAHKLGIVHRDIKPDNLFLTYEDDEMFLKVLDFGIAKQTGLPKASAVTGTGVMVGTPEYMSPEQVLSSKSVDFRSDLWALAVVAYHCLTGSVPFTGETLGSLCVSIASGEFAPPSTLRAGLPATVDGWFSKALHKQAQQRFNSSKETAITFASSLGPALYGNISSPGLSGDWSGSHPSVISNPAIINTPGAAATPFDDINGPTALAQSAASGPTPKAAQRVPTFAGTTLDVPKRRTYAAVGLVAVLALLGGAAFMLFTSQEQTAKPDPISEPSEPSLRAPASLSPKTGATSDLSAFATDPSADAVPSGEAPEPGPSADSPNEPKPQTHAPSSVPKPQVRPQLPRPTPRPFPKSKPPAPKPPPKPDRGF